MTALPDDIREALLDSAKRWLLNNYAGGSKKLEAFNDHYASLIKVYSFSFTGNRAANLRRLEKLTQQGVLLECYRYQKNGARSFTLPREQLEAIGQEAVRYWQDAGYVIGQMMDEIKYEYFVKIWGTTPAEGNYWFPTDVERELFIQAAIGASKYAGLTCVFNKEEGYHTRKRTVATMVMVTPDGVRHPYEYDYGYGWSGELAEYMFMDGNYSCDCNRSDFIGIEEMECGDTIKLEDFKIEYRSD